MEINVLIVDDDSVKLGRIHQILIGCGVNGARIEHALNTAQAVQRLEEKKFDLMFLDVNLPRRFGEQPRRDGGMDVIKEISDNPLVHPPRYIVGVSAYEDVVAEFGEQFADRLWALVHYQETSDRWISQISAKIAYIKAVRESDNFTDGETFGIDLGIICALDQPELDAVRNLPCGWQPLRRAHDETRYIIGTISGDGGKSLSVVAAAAPRMGMPAAAVLATKMITSFRPRIVAMTGICAGRSSKVGIGDIIMADPSWDWGSGKIDVVDETPRFRPLPHQISLDVDLINDFRDLARDRSFLDGIKMRTTGIKPDRALSVHFGPLASGAAVIANEAVLESVVDQNRGVLGLEMEAYGVASAALGSGKPRPMVVVVKSVCDFADSNKADDYQRYAAETSALFLYEAAKRFF